MPLWNWLILILNWQNWGMEKENGPDAVLRFWTIFKKKYPDDPEILWVKRHRMLINSVIVKRLQDCADYYHRIGRDDVAKDYLVEILRDYSETPEAVNAERMLAEIS